MGKHRLHGRWAKPDAGTVVVFPDGTIGRVNGETIAHAKRKVDTGDQWSAEDMTPDVPRSAILKLDDGSEI